MKITKNNISKHLDEIKIFHKVRLDDSFLELDIHKITDDIIPESFTEKTAIITKETNLIFDTINYLLTKVALLEKLNLYIDEMCRNVEDINKAVAPVPYLQSRQINLITFIADIRKKLIDLETEEDIQTPPPEKENSAESSENPVDNP